MGSGAGNTGQPASVYASSTNPALTDAGAPGQSVTTPATPATPGVPVQSAQPQGNFWQQLLSQQ